MPAASAAILLTQHNVRMNIWLSLVQSNVPGIKNDSKCLLLCCFGALASFTDQLVFHLAFLSINLTSKLIQRDWQFPDPLAGSNGRSHWQSPPGCPQFQFRLCPSTGRIHVRIRNAQKINIELWWNMSADGKVVLGKVGVHDSTHSRIRY